MADIPTTIPFLESAYAQKPVMPDTGGASFIRAYEGAQQRQLQQRELAMREAMLPLQQRVQEQNLAVGNVQLLNALHQRDLSLRAETGRAKLSEILGKMDWSDPEDRKQVWQIGVEHPELVPEIENIDKNLFVAHDKAAAQATYWQQQAELRGQQLEIAKSKAEAGPADVQTEQRISELRDLAETYRKMGETDKYQKYQQRAELLEQSLTKGESITAFGPGGEPVVQIQRGGKGTGAVPTGVATAAQNKLISFDNALQGIGDVLSKVSPQDVGVRGWVGENVFDKWIEQALPGTANTERISNRTALRALRENLFSAVSPERISGTGFSNKDAQRVKDLADNLGAETSYEEFRTKSLELSDIFRRNARTFAERSGTPVPSFAKTPEQITSDYTSARAALIQSLNEKRITQEQAQERLRALQEQARKDLATHGVNVNFQ